MRSRARVRVQALVTGRAYAGYAWAAAGANPQKYGIQGARRAA